MNALTNIPIDVPSGAWLRARSLPRTPRRVRDVARTEPTWSGRWHLSTGDREWDPRFGRHVPNVVCLCGQRIEPALMHDVYGQAYQDIVVADAAPAVDVCRRCAFRTGITLPADVGADWRTQAAARIARDASLTDAECGRRLRMVFGDPAGVR